MTATCVPIAIALRDITPEVIGRWQADRLAAGAGPVAIRHAMNLLGSILEHAFTHGRLSENPARRVKKARCPRCEEVQALSPARIEAMRSVVSPRDATLISVLAHAGLRPGEALGLRWGDVRERTLLIQRSISLGTEADTKKPQHRTVRLLASLASDLRMWRMASGAQMITSSCSRGGTVSPGRKRPTSRGAGARLLARSGRLGSRTRGRTIYVIALLRCCCTRGEVSST
jgi:integrase